jgi:hypothetical protein
VLHDIGNVVSQRYGVTLFPTTIVIAKGEIVGTRMGEITRERLQAMVDDAK